MILPKPVKAPKKPRKRIRTYRPAGTRRREAKAAGFVDPLTWQAIIDFYGGLCAYGCGRPATTMDHYEPIANGGTHSEDNVVPSCLEDNIAKGTGTKPLTRRHPWMAKEKA